MEVQLSTFAAASKEAQVQTIRGLFSKRRPISVWWLWMINVPWCRPVSIVYRKLWRGGDKIRFLTFSADRDTAETEAAEMPGNGKYWNFQDSILVFPELRNSIQRWRTWSVKTRGEVVILATAGKLFKRLWIAWRQCNNTSLQYNSWVANSIFRHTSASLV